MSRLHCPDGKGWPLVSSTVTSMPWAVRVEMYRWASSFGTTARMAQVWALRMLTVVVAGSWVGVKNCLVVSCGGALVGGVGGQS